MPAGLKRDAPDVRRQPPSFFLHRASLRGVVVVLPEPNDPPAEGRQNGPPAAVPPAEGHRDLGKLQSSGMQTPPHGNPVISVVIPVYGCELCLVELHRRLCATLETITPEFEILMVNDASPGGDWAVVEVLAAQDPRVKGINFSRNFGQHYAITAGLDYASGDWVVVMDCDLQDRPEEIPSLYHKALEGYDIVFARRANRQDSAIRRFYSHAFSRLYALLSGVRFDNKISNFSIVSRSVVQSFRSLRELNRSYGLLLLWLGYRTAFIDAQHSKRSAGGSSYTFRRLLSFATESLISQSNRPLWLSIGLGFFLSVGSLLFAAYLIFRYLAFGIPVPGWTSLMVSLYFLAGLLFANLGVLGLYLGHVYSQTKNRPLYVVRQAVNLPTNPRGN